MHLQYNKADFPRSADSDEAWGSFVLNHCVQVATFDIFDPRTPALLAADDYVKDRDSGRLAGVRELDASNSYQAWCCVMPRDGAAAAVPADDDTDREDSEADFWDSDLEDIVPRPAPRPRSPQRRLPRNAVGALTVRVLQLDSAAASAADPAAWTEVWRAPQQPITLRSDMAGGNPSTFFRFPIDLSAAVMAAADAAATEDPLPSPKRGPASPSLAAAASRVGMLNMLSDASRPRSDSSASSTTSTAIAPQRYAYKLQLVFRNGERGAEVPLLDARVGELGGLDRAAARLGAGAGKRKVEEREAQAPVVPLAAVPMVF
ncbi:hypothetical protein DFJ74DRAFT_256634 [Hyaloraphidium curvatum]|nr:hypothetical protein DFJ74DRAFT_256634 [Hyaloraphidium curvatum]